MRPSPYAQDGLPDRDLDAQFYEGVPFKRLCAWVIDFVISIALTLVATTLFGIATFGLGFLLSGLFGMIISFAYRWITLSNKSATWGMRLVAIEIRNQSGQRFDSGEAALHTLLFWVAFASGIGQLISVILMIGTPKGQGLHDMVMGSAAINRPAD